MGGAHPLSDWSIVIVRTKKGQEALNRALEKGTIRARKIEEEREVFTHLLSLAVRKKKIAREEVKKLKQEGLSIPPVNHALTFLQNEKSLMANKKIKDVMSRNPITVNPGISISQLIDMISKYHHMGYPVVNEKGELIGVVTFEDTMNVPKESRNKVSVGSIAKKKLVTAHPEDSVLDAFEKMDKHEIGRILIVDPQDPKKLLGVITRTDIMHALRRS